VRVIGTFSYKHQDLVALDTAALTDQFLDECWSTVRNAAGTTGSAKVKEQQFLRIASTVQSKWLVTGNPNDGRRELPASARAFVPAFKPPRAEDEVFLQQVAKLLPPQPWKPGIHLAVARELSVKPQRTRNAIQILIARGIFMQQRDGVVYDSAGNEITRDESR
jgi:hypothetical protein